MKEKNRKQPGLIERTFCTPPPPPPPPEQLKDREGLSSCTPRGEREDGNAGEMGVVLHGMELTALYPAKTEYDTRQSDRAYFSSVTAESLCRCSYLNWAIR